MTLALYGKPRRRQATLVALAVIALLAAMLAGARLFQPFSASADTTTTLLPIAQGSATGWTGDWTAVDGNETCANDNDAITGITTDTRESVDLDESGIPDGATITSVAITVCYAENQEDNGTFQTYARLAGVDYDSGVTLSPTTIVNASATQNITVPNVVKDASLDLEIGVLKTSGPQVEVNWIRAVVTYTPPSQGAGTIVLRKSAIGGDGVFIIQSADLGAQSLVTNGGTGSVTLGPIPAGTYSIYESVIPLGWDFTSLACDDPDDGTKVHDNLATIDLDANETVQCTWTNTRRVEVKIYKIVCQSPSDFPKTANALLALDTEAEITGYGGDDCDPASGWQFTYLNSAQDFGPTGSNGLATLTIPGDEIPGVPIRIGEVTQPGFVPFAATNGIAPGSALISCETDLVGAKDDYEDWIYDAQPGGIYNCVAFNAPSRVKVNVYKLVCESPSDFPTTADALLALDTEAEITTYGGDHCDPASGWHFTYLNANQDFGPTDSNGLATLTIPAEDIPDFPIRIGEVLQPGFVPFAATNGIAPGSALISCETDLVGAKDDYEDWVYDAQPGEIYNCVAFNAPAPGYVDIDKFAWDGDSWEPSEDAAFTFDITDTTGLAHDDVIAGTYPVRAGNVSVIENDPAAAEYTEFNSFFIALGLSCPTANSPVGVFHDGVPSAVGATVKPGETWKVCIYNRPTYGAVDIEKFLWDGDSWEPYAGDVFTFDISDQSGLAHDDAVAGTHKVKAGTVSVIENDPTALGYRKFESVVASNGRCPAAGNPSVVAHDGVPTKLDVPVAPERTTTVCVYNYRMGEIRVDKVTLAAGTPINERGGWAITVRGCGVDRTAPTSVTGRAVFDHLPLCPGGFTITEDVNSKPGFVATTGAIRNGIVAPPGVVTEVQFINERTCTSNCGSGSTTPTATASATPATATPVSTPATPTATTPPASQTPAANTPAAVDTVAGEITPGPTGTGGVRATPIAPATGSGMDGAAGSATLLAVILGLAAIGGGATILAIARRR